jgi:TolA-binding protein
MVLGIAVGVFAWLAVQSHREAGLGRTANAPPPRMREIPPERIELLSRIEPPVYEASADDSAPGSREFRAAMEEYRKRNYSGAIAGLQAATQAQSQSVEAHFYLAICLLMTNDRSAGIQELQAVTGAGTTPYLEAARFYLAKALLADRNIRGADVQLRVIVEMHGKLEKQAQTLHAQIVPTP